MTSTKRSADENVPVVEFARTPLSSRPRRDSGESHYDPGKTSTAARLKRTLIIGVLIVLGTSAVVSAGDSVAPYQPYIPEDKGLDPEWIASLSERGEQRSYQGDELDLIGMPCGGIGAGQLEISGNGTLGTWWIFNIAPPPNGGLGGYNGARYLRPAPIDKTVDNGFAIRIQGKDREPVTLTLDGGDFDALEFRGEYPIASFDYRRKANDLPVEIRSKVFSPFVPLSVRDSANPVTVVRFTVTNTSEESVDITLGGWLENACEVTGEDPRCNRTFRRDGLTGVQLGLQSEPAAGGSEARVRIPRTLAYDDFEGEKYCDRWEIEGTAFGDGPLVVAGARFYAPLRNQHGKAIASSFHSERDEDLEGSLTSKPFAIERSHIRFRIAGGDHKGETCINLMVGDEIVRTATGDNSNTLRLETWDVKDLQGKSARLEIVDRRKGSWGFVKVDDIAFFDHIVPYGNGRPAYGNLALSVLDEDAAASAGWTSAEQFIKVLDDGTDECREERTYGADRAGGGSVTSVCTIAPNESKTVTFLVSWYFPNLYNRERGCPGLVGHIYNNWYGSSSEAAQWVAEDFDRLYEQTELFRRTYHDTTLPYWLANRITMPVSTLACDNVKIWGNGRMYAYEGVSFCLGTCGHVYNFVAAIARLFPELERSVRLQQDLALAFDPASGRVNFRGAGGADPEHAWAYASDAQSGYVLKLYREHLMSPDNAFLDEVWPKVKRVIGYMIFHDGATRGVEPNGVIEDFQTFWDPMWFGPNPYNNTLYLAALRAAEEMARLKGESALADRYHEIFESGKAWMNERMWNGEYYVHLYPLGFNTPHGSNSARDVITPQQDQQNARDYIDAMLSGKPHYFVSTGCDAQQTFGQNWAHQLGLGYILPAEQCRTAAASIFKYNWAPDIKAVYDVYPPRHRTLAASGEGALVNGAWPKARRQSFENIHDKDDIWTGLEYQAACDMINEGLLQEALIVLKAIDERYDARKRNPWNEIEGAEHYSRAMHAWNVLLALSGYTYDGPAGKIGFAPRITPEDFKCFFSGAEGWGTFSQRLSAAAQRETIEVKWGEITLKTLAFDLPEGKIAKRMAVAIDGKNVRSAFSQEGKRVQIELAEKTVIDASSQMEITIEM